MSNKVLLMFDFKMLSTAEIIINPSKVSTYSLNIIIVMPHIHINNILYENISF